MTSQLLIIEETILPWNNNARAPSHWQLSRISVVGFRGVQLEKDSLNHLAIGVGPG